MISKKLIITVLVCISITATIVTAGDANDAEPKAKNVATVTEKQIKSGQKDVQKTEERKKEDYIIENQVLKYAIQSYEKTIDAFKWAIGGILTLIGILAAAVGFVVVKHKGEYKEAVKEAKEASKDASRYAEKSQDKLDDIDKKVEMKLKEIEEKGQAQIDKLIKEAEKRREESQTEAELQRKISQLWNEGLRAVKNEDYESAAKSFQQIVEDLKGNDAFACNNWGYALLELAKLKEGEDAEKLLAEAIAKFEKATKIKPSHPEAYNNWGAALSELAKRKEGEDAEKLLVEAIAKFEKATKIKPDHYLAYSNWCAALSELAKRKEGEDTEKLLVEAIAKSEKAIEIKPDFADAYDTWGFALVVLAKQKEGEERKILLEDAKVKLLKAESIKRGEGAYNLACVYCLLSDENECKKWLKVGEEEGALSTRENAIKDEDLESVRDKEWFNQIRWKGE